MLILKEVDGKYYHVDQNGDFILDGEGNKKEATADEIAAFKKQQDDDKDKAPDLSSYDLATLAKSNPAVASLLKEMKDTKEKLESIQTEADKKKQDDLKQKGEFQQLYESAMGEVEKYKGDYTKVNETLEKYKGTVNTILEQIVDDIPEENRSLIPSDFSPRRKLEYITQNAKALGVKKPAPNKGGGVPPNDDDVPKDQRSKLVARMEEFNAKVAKNEPLTPEENKEFMQTAKELKALNQNNT